MFAIYCHLDVHVYASDLTVIRKARKLFRAECRKKREHRAARHRLYRSMLREHVAARKLYHCVQTGDFAHV